jgi:dihydrofolate synthase/folylpolyglutamate synthase
MRRTLSDWLDYQLRVHPKSIDMGLERVGEVARRLGLGRPARCVITVGGTNGKGSTVAFIEAGARAAGLRVGAYTSPHLLRYNERVRIDGAEATDAALCAAFEAIEAARVRDSPVPLTYFEYGTLAALRLFGAAGLDLAILEVGLGGRLDATNFVDADVAVITTVDLDHQDYLGPDREAIGFEKAGILRAGKPCVLGEKDPPSSVLRRAYELGAFAIRGHSDYLVDRHESHWVWREPGCEIELPYPRLAAPVQLDNAAAAIAALRASGLPVEMAALRTGVAQAGVAGRLQRIADSPETVVDVGHNPQALRQVAAWLQANPRPTDAVFAALADKKVEELARILQPAIRRWHLAGIDDAGSRNLDAMGLAARLSPLLGDALAGVHADVAGALSAARSAAAGDERVLVFGSFHTVAAAMRAVEPL